MTFVEITWCVRRFPNFTLKLENSAVFINIFLFNFEAFSLSRFDSSYQAYLITLVKHDEGGYTESMALVLAGSIRPKWNSARFAESRLAGYILSPP